MDFCDMEPITSVHSTISTAKNQISCKLDGERVILNLDTGVYYGLDAIGAQVWDLIQEPKTVLEVQDILLTEYDVEADTCRNDLLALIQEMAAQKLIEVKDGSTTS